MDNCTEKEIIQGRAGRLWTKNFTIITVGTVISMLGNALANFALGLLVLDYTNSTFLYALYMVIYNVPQVIVPTLAGPFLDKFSRRKVIYTLDFMSAGVYGIFALLIIGGYFNYGFLVAGSLFLGTIDSIYRVAYDSFYPMLIEEGNYSKAYSIQSTLDSLTMFMVPVSAVVYNLVGIAPLFLINMASFFIAAVMETQIKKEEAYIKKEGECFGLAQYRKTFSEGVSYLREERGLMVITLYFMVTMFSNGAFSALVLPYFKMNFPNGEYLYIFTMGFMTIGRLVGGVIQYRISYPVNKRFATALFVYITLAIIDGGVLYLPFTAMQIACFTEGILGVTSYNIRISATQSYVPDERKGRFNGIFQMATMFGLLGGQFLSGVLTALLPERVVISLFMSVNLLAALVLMGGQRKYVKPIYNRKS